MSLKKNKTTHQTEIFCLQIDFDINIIRIILPHFAFDIIRSNNALVVYF